MCLCVVLVHLLIKSQFMRMTYTENPWRSYICTCGILRIFFLFLNYFKLLIVQWAELRISNRVLCMFLIAVYRGVSHKVKCKLSPYKTGKATYFSICGDLEIRMSDVINASLEVWHQGSIGRTVSDTCHWDLSMFHQVWEMRDSRGFWPIIPQKPSSCLHYCQHTRKFLVCTEVGNFCHCTEASKGVPCLL